jgi:hypothetical protein
MFDRPLRGYRRAVVRNPEDIPEWLWTRQLASELLKAPLPRDELIERVAATLESTVCDEDCARNKASLVETISAAVERAIERGVLVNKNGIHSLSAEVDVGTLTNA